MPLTWLGGGGVVVGKGGLFSMLCSKENWREPSAPNLQNLGCPAYDLYEKIKIFYSPENKHLAPGATGLC